MTSKLVEVGFDYWAAHVGWAKIKTNTSYSIIDYSIIEWFNMQVFMYKRISKKEILCSNSYMANIV